MAIRPILLSSPSVCWCQQKSESNGPLSSCLCSVYCDHVVSPLPRRDEVPFSAGSVSEETNGSLNTHIAQISLDLLGSTVWTPNCDPLASASKNFIPGTQKSHESSHNKLSTLLLARQWQWRLDNMLCIMEPTGSNESPHSLPKDLCKSLNLLLFMWMYTCIYVGRCPRRPQKRVSDPWT